MRRVTLDHDRATGSQGRRGITAGNRIGERKIARTKHSDRSQWYQHAAQVWLRHRRARGITVVNVRVNP